VEGTSVRRGHNRTWPSATKLDVMQDNIRMRTHLLFAVASMGVVSGAAVLLGVPWRGVLVAVVTMILSAAAMQGLRRRDDSEDADRVGRILYLRKRRGAR
jgi:hypothetical protein